MKVRKEVADAEDVIARIKGKPTESELIEDQEDLRDEDEPEEEDHQWCHTMDSHSCGSFVYTCLGAGLNGSETTLTRFAERKKR